MPHSSGGGHAGGGFHGGGGFHSSGYHSSGGLSNYNFHRFSRFRFYGASRYVFYYHCRPHFIYSDTEPHKVSVAKAWSLSIFLFIFLILPLAFVIPSSFHFPKKLSTDYDTSIVIDDAGNYLTTAEEAQLKTTFTYFLNKTGITPSFTSIDSSTSMLWPYDLESYAYADYVSKFKDEKHWLIVYRGGSNWTFEGMQGNDTDNILTKKVTTIFNSALYNSLSFHASISDALTRAFDKITPTIMDNSFYIDDDIVAPIAFWTAISAVAFIASVFRLVNTYRIQDAVECPDSSKLTKCPYCDTPYYTGTIKKCPKCGADLGSSKFSNTSKKDEKEKAEDEFAIDPDQFKIDNDNF